MGMTPPTVNAYYNPLENNINFPAGILQPPFFERTNGRRRELRRHRSVIGHEAEHGFDDQGRKFGPDGNLADWWTSRTAKEFEKRASCIADEYSEFTVAGGCARQRAPHPRREHADNGGVPHRAHGAAGDAQGREGARLKDGFTPEQPALPGLGPDLVPERDGGEREAAGAGGPALARPLSGQRVVVNMPEFQQAFSCAKGSPMVRENACHVWLSDWKVAGASSAIENQPHDRRPSAAAVRELAGLGSHVVRVLYVVVSVISAAFPGILVYLVLWVVMPQCARLTWRRAPVRPARTRRGSARPRHGRCTRDPARHRRPRGAP